MYYFTTTLLGIWIMFMFGIEPFEQALIIIIGTFFYKAFNILFPKKSS